MRLEFRLITYFVLPPILAAIWIWYEYKLSESMLAQDPSALAWFGFFPFIYAILWAETQLAVGILAIIFEFLLFIVRWLQKGNTHAKNTDC